MKKLFVWDFHGTLEIGTQKAVVEVSNTILKKNKFSQKFTLSLCRRLSGLKWYKYFQFLLPQEPRSLHLKLQEDCFRFSDSHPQIIVKHIRPTPHSHYVLRRIQKKHLQILISNTKPSSLKIFINAIKVNKFFTNKNSFAVDGHGPTRRQNKLKILKKYLKNHPTDQLIVIGDTKKDISLASLHPKSISYLFSYPHQNFKDCQANFKIHDLRQVLHQI